MDLYVGLVKYVLTKDNIIDDNFRIGHQPTSNLHRILDWKEKTEQLQHVVECQVFKLINENKNDNEGL
jgi:hypothetical protein